MRQQWQDKLGRPSRHRSRSTAQLKQKLPTLYGFVIKFSVVALVTYDANQPTRPIRTLVSMNHAIDGTDPWHALAVSIVCIRARNILMELDSEGYFGEELTDDDDPDA